MLGDLKDHRAAPVDELVGELLVLVEDVEDRVDVLALYRLANKRVDKAHPKVERPGVVLGIGMQRQLAADVGNRADGVLHLGERRVIDQRQLVQALLLDPDPLVAQKLDAFLGGADEQVIRHLVPVRRQVALGQLVALKDGLQGVDRVERHVAVGPVDGAQHDVAHVLDLLLQVDLHLLERAIGLARDAVKLIGHLRRHAGDDVAGMQAAQDIQEVGNDDRPAERHGLKADPQRHPRVKAADLAQRPLIPGRMSGPDRVRGGEHEEGEDGDVDAVADKDVDQLRRVHVGSERNRQRDRGDGQRHQHVVGA